MERPGLGQRDKDEVRLTIDGTNLKLIKLFKSTIKFTDHIGQDKFAIIVPGRCAYNSGEAIDALLAHCRYKSSRTGYFACVLDICAPGEVAMKTNQDRRA